MELVEMRPVWSMSGSEMLAALDALHTSRAQQDTYRLQLLAGIDQNGHAKDLGARDTVELLAFRHRLDATEVRRDLKLATTLPKYAAVSAALPDPFAATSPDGTTQYTDPTTKDPAGDDEGASAGEAAGQLPVLLHPAQAEAIVSALEKVPAATVPVENLLAAEEKMVEAARHLNPMELRKLGKQVRDILDTDGPEPAEDKAYKKEALWLKNADHGVRFGGYLANENAELLRTLIHAGSKPHKTVTGELDPRPRDKRQADTLTAILNTAARGEAVPGHGGIKAHVAVTMDFDDLKTTASNATGDLVFGDGLSAAAVRRLACDAGIIPIVLGSNSQPLDVGMEQRFVTGAMRNALNQRDKGCVVCGAPPARCEAHHLVHWVDGGATAIWNLVLLCKGHHIDIHNGHWTIRITNGVVQVSRPTWADPHPRRADPRRSGPTRTGLRRTEPEQAGPGRATRARPDHGRDGPTPGQGPPAPRGDPPDDGEDLGGQPTGWSPNDGRPPGHPPADNTPNNQPSRPARAWPWTSDVPWITKEEAEQLNPWGDQPDHRPATTRGAEPDASTWVSPWSDEDDQGAA